MRAANKTGPTNLKARERERSAIDLRRAGHSYSEIGRKLRCGSSTAHRAVKGYLTRIVEENTESAREVLALELERLDALLAAVWPQAQAGHLGAVDRALRIEERRARLLGLDKSGPATLALDTQQEKEETVDYEKIFGLIEDAEREQAEESR